MVTARSDEGPSTHLPQRHIDQHRCLLLQRHRRLHLHHPDARLLELLRNLLLQLFQMISLHFLSGRIRLAAFAPLQYPRTVAADEDRLTLDA